MELAYVECRPKALCEQPPVDAAIIAAGKRRDY
jgi:hypothetical protein